MGGTSSTSTEAYVERRQFERNMDVGVGEGDEATCVGGEKNNVVSGVWGDRDGVVTLDGDENAVPPTPSSGEFGQHEKALHSDVEEVNVGGPVKCFMKNGWCETHNSVVMKVKTKVKKWTYLG